MDVTIIEIRKEDIINNFLSLDDTIFNNNIYNFNDIYENESLYVLHHINGKDIYVSYGILNNIEDNKIMHKCNTDSGSSGSPIILLKNNKVIGIHYGGSKQINFNFNFGTLLKIPILDYLNKEYKKKENKIKINKEIKNEENINKDKINIENKNKKIKNKTEEKINKENKNKENYIISEINIKEEDLGKKIRIINSFEECIRNHYLNVDKNEYYKYENEKEIKENCKIKINDININFNYFHEFKEKGKYIIKYIFTNNLTNTNCMFCDCKSLINIDLSNFNTQNITNMKSMFYNCKSLTNLDLSNFNTQNVTDMRSMFYNCKSLISLDLSNFNTRNVTDKGWMFFGCELLKKENIITKDKKLLKEFKLYNFK